MKKLIPILLLAFLAAQIHAQIAVSGRYLSNSTPEVENIFIDLGIGSGYEVGVGYWFRLKNKRMEFIPEVSYGSISADGTGNITTFGFNSNIQIYPLDFHSDCDACPTFSKEGGLIKKGFYWIINPGLLLVDSDINSNFTYRVGLGGGLDIGVTNLLTVSPFAMYSFAGNGIALNETQNGNLNQIHIGARLIFRYDRDRW